MPHGLVETGVQFPDSTIQTTAEGIIPPGTMYVCAPNTTVPSGWFTGGILSKSAAPTLYSVFGDETDVSMIPSVTTTNWGVSAKVEPEFIETARNLQTIATNGSGVWMVLSNSGRIYLSTDDAVSWTSSVPVNSTDLYAVTWGFGTTWVAVGNGGKSIYTTNNGASWAAATTPIGGDTRSVVYDPIRGRFMASLANGNVWVSTNGSSWSLLVDVSGDDYIALAYGNGYLVGGGTSGNIYASSNGGSSWTTFTDPLGGEDINSVIYGNGRFFAVGNNGEMAYTKVNSNPTISSNWIFLTAVPRRGTTGDATSELVDAIWIESKKIWVILTETGEWYWAPDFGQDSLEFYRFSGSSSWVTDPGIWKYSVIAPNDTIVILGVRSVRTSTAYGTTIDYFPHLYTGSLNGKLQTSPATHFYTPTQYVNPGTYFENTAKVIIKA